jgi:hypothetical protein
MKIVLKINFVKGTTINDTMICADIMNSRKTFE